MKAKLTIDGKEFEVEITEEQVQALTETKKKTGYERVAQGEFYYTALDFGVTEFLKEDYEDYCNDKYECANYYSDRTVARNNSRADKLYRQLRRFAVEHRKEEIDWNNKSTKAIKFYIFYNHSRNTFGVSVVNTCQDYGNIYFDTKESARLAIDTFKDELLWYFTEYKDSL